MHRESNAPQLNKVLDILCDAINLPNFDKYRSQSVLSLLRQIVEKCGFFRPSDFHWVSLQRIKFVATCNPPSEPDCEGKSVVLFLEQPAILFSMLEVLNMFFTNDIFEEIDQKTLFACIFKEAERIECNIDSADRASLACGPLLMCALAQTKNAEKLQELRKFNI
ncbi:hypothetical protein B566_EDAN005087 [Ephemera danica]|nr:hypothetical protein B566_EDAN005087 [Ephemera danica]